MANEDLDAITLDNADPEDVDVRIEFYKDCEPHLRVQMPRDPDRSTERWKVSIGRTGRVAFAREITIREYTPQLKDDEGRALYIDNETGEHTPEEYYTDGDGRQRWRHKAHAPDKALAAHARYDTDYRWANKNLSTNVLI